MRICVLAAIGLATLAAAPAADAKKRPCKSRGSSTVVASDRARVFATHRDSDIDGEYYACLYGRKRDKRLAVWRSSAGGSRDGVAFQLFPSPRTHQLVAFAQIDCGFYDCGYIAKTIDLDTGKRKRLASGPGLRSLRPAATGSLALIDDTSYPWEAGPSYRVRKVESRGTTVLDEGPDIDPASLAVAGSWVYWRRGSVTHTATIE
jgi:hypothetical protein